MRAFAFLFALVGMLGCRLVDPAPKGRSPLAPLVISPDAIALEVFSVPAPLGDPQMAALWTEVDEQPLPADLRARLAQNGLRAGIVGNTVPDALAALLKVTDERISADDRALVPIEAEEGIALTVMQPRIGERRDLVTSAVHDQIALFRHVDKQVEGKTYHKAEGRLALRVFRESDGRTRLELTPELHHGEFKSRVRGSDGIMILKQERQMELFDELKMSATLAPGQMLLITCQPDRPGTVGHCFFTQADGEKPIQKLYVLRVSQARPDRSFYEAPADNSEPVASDLRQ
jgi:hypothetical protein